MPRRTSRMRRGQAMIEFAVTVVVFLLAVLVAMYSGLMALQWEAAVTASGLGARAAAGGIVSTTGSTDLSNPNLTAGYSAASNRLGPALGRTSIQPALGTTPCPAAASIPHGTVYVCVHETLAECYPVGLPAYPPPCLGNDQQAWQIEVEVRGYPINPVASLVSAWPLLDVGATGVQVVTFKR